MSTVLSPKQERFVREYLVVLNAAAAYRKAGYRCKTDRVAEAGGSRLLRNVKVAAAVKAEQERLATASHVTAQEIVAELKLLGFSDLRAFQTTTKKGVQIKPSTKWPEEAGRAVQEISQASDGSIRIKLHSKTQALLYLGKHVGMFVKEQESPASQSVHVNVYIPANDRDARRIADPPATG